MARGGMDSLLKGRWTIWVLSIVFALIAGFGVLAIIGSAAEQVTYYVTAQNVPARTALTGDMITLRTANADGVPATALSLQQLQQQTLYTRIPLAMGEPITRSNVGPASRITAGLPADFVAASLSVSPDNAAAGKISRGDYVDIAAVVAGQDQTTSKVVLHNVLVLDVSVSPDTIARAATATNAGGTTGTTTGTSGAPGPDSAAARTGIPQLYTFAVSPQDFVTLALLRDSNPYLALTQGYAGDVSAYTTAADVFGTAAAGNSGAGTEGAFADPTASAVPSPGASGMASAPASPSADATVSPAASPSAAPTASGKPSPAASSPAASSPAASSPAAKPATPAASSPAAKPATPAASSPAAKPTAKPSP